MTLSDIRKQAEEKYPDGLILNGVPLGPDSLGLALARGVYIQGRLDQAAEDARIIRAGICLEQTDPYQLARDETLASAIEQGVKDA